MVAYTAILAPMSGAVRKAVHAQVSTLISLMEIGAGTNQIRQVIIAEELLK